MRSVILFSALFFASLAVGCKSSTQPTAANHSAIGTATQADVHEPNASNGASPSAAMPATPDSVFVDLKNYSKDFIYDIKYATTDNFLKSQVYDCAECYLRLKTAEALIAANDEFIGKGFRIKIFDCYRPLDIQKKMWKIVSNPSYVANPAKGSIHNRGGAIDITLVDKNGRELDMGTAFDHFGPEAASAYTKLSSSILSNRKLLEQVMSRHGFKVLASEWWHFDLNGAASQKLSNFKWDCD